MANETEQAGWAAAALVTVGALIKGAFGRSARRDDVIVQLLKDCEERHDDRDARHALLEAEVRSIAAEHATIKAEHALCPDAIAKLRQRVYRLEYKLTPANGTPMVDTGPQATMRDDTGRVILPPPLMHESVGGHER